MKNRGAIFLDRDGTINVDKGYSTSKQELEFVPNAVEGLKKLWAKFPLIIVTNQSGIARGLFTEKDYYEFKERMHRNLLYQGVYIAQEYFCPHLPEDNCKCRKPKTGMLEAAAEYFDLNLRECWMIGDKTTDILAGMNSFCRTIHVLTGKEKKSPVYANFFAKDMVEAADIILKNTNNK